MTNARQLMAYFLTSGLAALVNLLSRLLYCQWTDFNSAVVYAYFTGMIVNFFLSSILVFPRYSDGTAIRILLKFSAVTAIGLLVTLEVSGLARQHLLWLGWFSVDYSELVAHGIGIGTAFFASFAGHSLFTYRKTGLIVAIRKISL